MRGGDGLCDDEARLGSVGASPWPPAILSLSKAFFVTIAIDDISVSTPTLDDVFLNLTGRPAEQEAETAEVQAR